LSFAVQLYDVYDAAVEDIKSLESYFVSKSLSILSLWASYTSYSGLPKLLLPLGS
jgi:hypothetical protein